jgi:CII-binding regulator of phage lambda lysogenization HflD
LDEFRTHEHAMALAGLFQAVSLVQQVAREGIFRIDADNTNAVYGSSTHLAAGCRFFAVS